MAQKKKVVYFLGAGASFGAGAKATVQAGHQLPIPTQATFWPTFLRFCKSQKNRARIESFLFRYFLGYGKTPVRTPAAKRRHLLTSIDVEEVFTFLSERTRAPSTSTQLRTYALQVWGALAEEIGQVFSRFNANSATKAIYKDFLKHHFRRFDTVVSFNYDTIFENSLPARRSARYVGLRDSAGTIPLLKPHGSVNWVQADDGTITVGNPVGPAVIVAPTHFKFISNPDQKEVQHPGYLDQAHEIQKIWAEMEREMRFARSLVFIGYSFPVADLYFASVLRSVLADRDTTPNIVIVNPDAVAISERLLRRFPLVTVSRFFDLAQFIRAGRAVIAQ